MTTNRTYAFGTSGLRHYSGYVSDDFLAKLNGIRGVRVYDEMRRNSPVIGAIMRTIETLMAQATWKFDPPSSDQIAVDTANLFNDMFQDMDQSWIEILDEICTMFPFGWAYLEAVWRLRPDGFIAPKKLALRPQDSLRRWEFGECDEILGMWQAPVGSGADVFVPLTTSLLFRTRVEKNNPEGMSLIRNAVRAYQFVKHLEEVEAIGLERNMAGYPVFQVPKELMSINPTADQTALRTYIENAVQSMRNDERKGLVIPSEIEPSTGLPSGFKFSLVSAPGGSQQADVDKTITRHKVEILQSTMSEIIQLGMGQTGSWALADSKTHIMAMAIGAHMDRICGVINRQLVPKIAAMNSIPKQVWPRFTHSDIETPSLTEMLNSISLMSGLGYRVNTPEIERHVLDLARLPVEEVK